MPYTRYPPPILPTGDSLDDAGMLAMPQLVGSEQLWVDDLMADRTNSGAVRMRSFYPTKKKAFRLLHFIPDETQFGHFQTFYNSYRRTQFRFKWASESTYAYWCLFASPPAFTHTGTWIEASVELVEV